MEAHARVDTVTRVGAGVRDIRRAVTRRCSGYSRGEECKFSLLLDVAESEVKEIFTKHIANYFLLSHTIN